MGGVARQSHPRGSDSPAGLSLEGEKVTVEQVQWESGVAETGLGLPRVALGGSGPF